MNNNIGGQVIQDRFQASYAISQQMPKAFMNDASASFSDPTRSYHVTDSTRSPVTYVHNISPQVGPNRQLPTSAQYQFTATPFQHPLENHPRQDMHIASPLPESPQVWHNSQLPTHVSLPSEPRSRLSESQQPPRTSTTNMRQLPIVTERGPRQINRQPLHSLNTSSETAQNFAPNLTQDQSSDHRGLDSRPNNFPYPHDKTTHGTLDQHRYSFDQPSQRKLPIVTRDGVMKLRDTSSGNDQMIAKDHMLSPDDQNYGESPISYDSVTDETDNPDREDSFIHSGRKASEITTRSIKYEAAYCNKNERHFEPQLDIDNEHISEDPSATTTDQDEESKSYDNEIASIEDDDSQYPIYTVSDLPEKPFVPRGNQEDFGPQLNLFQDRESPNDELMEEEAEYFSALATVPEEEGKLSDKDTVQESDPMESSNYVSEVANDTGHNFNGSRKLPTIIENGFEAQVLDYLAGKTGLKRSELFSVDEEPSGENEARTSEELQIDGSQSESIDTNAYKSMNSDGAYNARIERADRISADEQCTESFNDGKKPESIFPKENLELARNDIDHNKKHDNLPSGLATEAYGYNRECDNHRNQDSYASQITNTSYPNNIRGEKPSLDSSHGLNDHFEDSDYCDTRSGYEEQRSIPKLTISAVSDKQNDMPDEEMMHPDAQMYQLYKPAEDEDEDCIMISPPNDKTSLEQEEYDEQYRDINNLEDIERRATNHVHAIDGHSKSMLNDIHQQRTIVDYFDESDYANGNRYDDSNQQTKQIESYDQQKELMESEFDQDLDGQKKVLIDTIEEVRSMVKDENALADSCLDLPPARIRWIKAYNKIVNRSNEVSVS